MSTVKYIHIRPGTTYTKEGGLQGTPETRGGATVAYEEDGHKTTFSFAICSPKDAYNRKRGRHIASKRLAKGMTHVVSLREGETAPEAILTVYGDALAPLPSTWEK